MATIYPNKKDGKIISEEFGEMLFTHFGVSGPIILTMSRAVAKFLSEKSFVEILINLKPALTPEQLDARILRDFEKFKHKSIKNALIELLPTKIILPILDLSYIEEDKKIDAITKEERLPSPTKNLLLRRNLHTRKNRTAFCWFARGLTPFAISISTENSLHTPKICTEPTILRLRLI